MYMLSFYHMPFYGQAEQTGEGFCGKCIIGRTGVSLVKPSNGSDDMSSNRSTALRAPENNCSYGSYQVSMQKLFDATVVEASD